MTSLVPAIRRFSVIDVAETMISFPQQKERRPSQQDMADSAMLFLERRRSSDHGIGTIQPDLYRRRGSVVNHQSSGAKPSVARVQVQMSYDFSKSDFLVSLLEVCDVMKLDEYCIAISLSDTVCRRESSKIVAGATFHKENFKFALSYDDLLDKSLTLQLVGSTRIGAAPAILGCTTIDLSSIDPSDDVILWSDIEMQDTNENLGEIFVGIQYLPSAERLTVTVHQARGLPSKEGLPNSLAKIYLVQDGKMVKKRKSGVRKNSGNPVWNEALNFTVTTKQLQSCQLEIHILDYDRIGNHKLLGQVSFGCEPRDRMWKDLLSLKPVNPKWIPLRFL